MRKLFTLLVAVLLTASVFAQSPEKMSYQAVIRNASNNLVTNTAVGMQITILQGSASGSAVYTETQTPTTNVNGLVSIEIGAGTVVGGNISTINWANGTYFIKTETDPAGGANYTIIGTSQLLSVPYALHAKTAETVDNMASIAYVDSIFNILKTDTLGFSIDFTYTIDKVYAYYDNTQNYVAQFTIVDMSNGVPSNATKSIYTNLLNYGVGTNGNENNAVSYKGEYYIKLEYEIDGKLFNRTKVIKLNFDYLAD